MTSAALPQIAGSRKIDTQSPLKIWSAACSTGAEPYTLAMVASEFLQPQQRLPVSILATDICTEVLQAAVRGVYPTDMCGQVPEPYRRKYLMKARDRQRQEMRIVPELRALVKFGRLNLMASAYPVDRDYDMIFCRNILIYFEKNVQEAVLNRLCGHLRPGGYLFLGHSESIAGISLPLTALGHTVFRRS